MDQTSSGLLRRCIEAIGDGSDFPMVWQTILRSHWLVVGPPEQRMEGDRAQLQIPLATGQRLVFDSTSKTFSLG